MERVLGALVLVHRCHSRVLLAVSGTLQDGYVLRRNLDADGTPARFVGWALVRGVRLYIDTKAQAQCREHVPVTASGRRQNVNPAAVCTGDARDVVLSAVVLMGNRADAEQAVQAGTACVFGVQITVTGAVAFGRA